MLPVQDRVMGSQYCSYRVGGVLDEPYLPTTLEEAVSVLEMVRTNHKTLTVLGGGSNTIVASQGIRGVTFLSKRLLFIEPIDATRVRFGSGVPMAKVCKAAQDLNLTGAEFMIGVPGTLGGGVTMNAGAMGQETADILEFAILYNLDSGKLEEWPHEQLHFAYRKSAIDFKRTIVLGAQLKLSPGNPDTIARLIKESVTFRQTHHPKEPNGGSVFKNPSIDHPSGKLLDQCGAKGWQEGGAMVSPMHANFIVNTSNATSTDILKLMLRMKHAVYQQFNIAIFPENRFLGDATSEEITIWEELTGNGWPY